MIVQHFRPGARVLHQERFGSGHIHDTYLVRLDDGVDYVLQRMNTTVFPDPDAVCRNVQRVCEHLGGTPRRSLTWLRTPDGGILARDESGAPWRMCLRIPRVRSVDRVESEHQAWQAGYAFGDFQARLSDLPGPRLDEVLPGFHDTPRRYGAFEAAVAADPLGRAATVAEEIAFARSRRTMAGRLLDLHRAGAIPERITHNDTKINNVLLDEETGEALCVIDLDTVMPGLAHYDFGDMVRTVTNAGEEDEADLSRVEMRRPLYDALLRGYLEAAGGFLNETEIAELPFSGKLLTYEVALRFLTDHLLGDTYFRIHHPGHNLQRARAQFALLRSMERQL